MGDELRNGDSYCRFNNLKGSAGNSTLEDELFFLLSERKGEIC